MAGWLHGVTLGVCPFVPPQCCISLSLFCNYLRAAEHANTHSARYSPTSRNQHRHHKLTNRIFCLLSPVQYSCTYRGMGVWNHSACEHTHSPIRPAPSTKRVTTFPRKKISAAYSGSTPHQLFRCTDTVPQLFCSLVMCSARSLRR